MRTTSTWPALTSASTWSTTASTAWLRLPPRANGTMQKLHRCWQPSCTFTKARVWPGAKCRTGMTGSVRAWKTSLTWTSGRTRFRAWSRRPGKAWRSWVPRTTSTPGDRRDRVRVRLGVAPRHHDHRVRVPRDGAPDGLAVRVVRAGRHRARVDHVDLRRRLERHRAEALGLEERLDLRRVVLVQLAPERRERHCHRGQASLSDNCPHAPAPTSGAIDRRQSLRGQGLTPVRKRAGRTRRRRPRPWTSGRSPVRPASRSARWNARMRSGGGRRKLDPGHSLNGIRFTLARSPWSRRTSRFASSAGVVDLVEERVLERHPLRGPAAGTAGTPPGGRRGPTPGSRA